MTFVYCYLFPQDLYKFQLKFASEEVFMQCLFFKYEVLELSDTNIFQELVLHCFDPHIGIFMQIIIGCEC